MSNIIVAVGGSGSKFLQAGIHLAAAGLLPPKRPEMEGLVVDPDSSNGNFQDLQQVCDAYQRCKLIKVGDTNLFNASIKIAHDAWTPLSVSSADTLRSLFHYEEYASREANGQAAVAALEADLLDVLFEQDELDMKIQQGFRGRPAIGATILAETVDFTRSPWKELNERIRASANKGPVNVLLAGSVFGGSGAAGVPTLVRLLHENLRGDLANLRIGLALFLPFFHFTPVPGERIQADPTAFAAATAEALKYYHERGFLTFCNSIFAVGEETPAEMAVSAVGASEQHNQAHFVEMVAAMGAMRFFSDLPRAEFKLNVAARKDEDTVTWGDLPYADLHAPPQIAKLQQMCVFAVAYRFLFYPALIQAVQHQGKPPAFWEDHVVRKSVDINEAGTAVQDVYHYTEKFLKWLMDTSTPRRQAFRPGLVNPNVFATSQGQNWRLKTQSEFIPREFSGLLLNTSFKARIDDRSAYTRASGIKIKDPGVQGPGHLIRALYDACALD